MEKFDVQIAEFEHPFPSKIFEQELDNDGIEFKQYPRNMTELGMDIHVYYVQNSDFDKAFAIKEKVERENAESEFKHTHPAWKILAYITLLLILIYVIYTILDVV